MKKTEFIPVILGSDENAYGCARLFFEEYGVRSVLLCSRPLPETSGSRILTRRVIKEFDTPEVFSTVIQEIVTELKKETGNVVLIPCSDYYTGLFVRLPAEIKKSVLGRFPSDSVYAAIRDKAAFALLCENAGLPHPETLILSPYLLMNTDFPFDYPVVLKPVNSNSSSYLRATIKDKKKVYFCKKRSEVREVAENFIRSGFLEKIIVQPFIPGGDGNLRVINAYCDADSNVRLIGIARPLLQYRDPASVGNYAALETLGDRRLCDEAVLFLRKINYSGFANFDLKIHPETGKAYFLELNPRPGRSSYYLHTAGKNLMKTFASDVVFGERFCGTEYAEARGIWADVPDFVIRAHADFIPERPGKTDRTTSLFFDFSPSRALTLLKRDASRAALFEKYAK